MIPSPRNALIAAPNPHTYAVKEITRSSGTQFDPEVIQHFIEISHELADLRENKNGSGLKP